MRGCEEFLHEFYFSRLKWMWYNKKRANSMFAPCKFFFSTGKSRLRVIPFIYFISCLFIVYYSIPEVSSIGIQVYRPSTPEVSSEVKKYRGPDCEASDRVLVFKKELVVIVDISSNSSLIRVRHRSLRARHVYLRVRLQSLGVRHGVSG